MPTNTSTWECCYCERVYLDNRAYYSLHGDRLCFPCYEDHYFTCQSCDEVMTNDEYGEDGNCQTCANELPSGRAIESSCYLPAFHLKKMPWENTLYQGVELEIEFDEDTNPRQVAAKFQDWLKSNGLDDVIYCKEDGSLANGFEVVSHPHTPIARHKGLPWYKILKWLKDHGAKSDSMESTGYHIHLSKGHFSNVDLWKMKVFFSLAQAKIEKIAGRSGNSYCSYPMSASLTSALDYAKRQLPPPGEGRYCAVNINEQRNKPTVELRVFKGTLVWSRFIGRLQFSEAVAEFVKTRRMTYKASNDNRGIIQGSNDLWREFKQFVRSQGRFGHLERLMKKVRV